MPWPSHLFAVPARFESHSENITLHAGQDARMECLATGHEPLEIQWRKQGALYTRLELEDKFRIETATERHSLRSTLTVFKVCAIELCSEL